MVSSCSAYGCTYRYKAGEQVGFFLFPKKNKKRRELWIKAIKRENWTPTDTSKVCGKHFQSGKPSIKPDHPDYVPNVFTYSRQKSSVASYERRQSLLHKRNENAEQEPAEDCTSAGIADEEASAAEALLLLGSNFEQEQSDKDLIKKLYIEIDNLRMEKKKMEEEVINVVKLNDYCLTILNDPKKISFYTGLPSHAMFKALLAPMADSVTLNKKLSAEAQLLIVLMKLKLNLLNTDLAYRFGVSRRTVQRIFDALIPSLALHLEVLIRWPTQKALKKKLPTAFQSSKYKNTVCIIDCTEVAIERPSGQISKSQTWSNYKHSQTLKFLVGTTPSGQICYVSDAWGGRSSDKDVTLNCGILNYIEPGDVILADRGFQIDEVFAEKGAKLIVPTFTRGKKQLSKHEVEHSKRVSNVRIHVERVIAHIKKFRVLKGKMPITFLKYVDCVITICAGICNLCPPIVR